MKPSSVSPLQYINDSLGIDASKSTKYSRSSGVLSKDISYVKSVSNERGEGVPIAYCLEKIYDVVVGFNHEQGQRFRNDSGLSTPQRFGATELKHVIEHSQAIISRPGTSESDKEIFGKIIQASQMYKDLLEGRIDKVPKNAFPKMGNRHTLIRGNNGRVFEMLNSMTEKELARCSEKTGRLISAVENPINAGKRLHRHIAFKVELGSGAFGKTRIAREIGSDVRGGYVAVKKTHPEVLPSMSNGLVVIPSSTSNFYNLTEEQKNKLRRINQAVIVPIDSKTLHSKQSTTMNERANSFNGLQIRGDVEAFIRNVEAILGDLMKHFTSEEGGDFLLKKVNNEFQYQTFDEKSQYTFSELGVTTIQPQIQQRSATLDSSRGR